MKASKQIALAGLLTLAIGILAFVAGVMVEINSQSPFAYPRIESFADYMGLVFHGDISPSAWIRSIAIAFIGIAPVVTMFTVWLHGAMASLQRPVEKRFSR